MQLKQIKEYINNRKWNLTVEFQNVGSCAKTRPKREERLKLAMRREIDAILVWQLDRIGRGMVDLVTSLIELRGLDVDFVSLTESPDFFIPSGQAMAGMLSTIAEIVRDIARERLKAGTAGAQEREIRHGRRKTVALKTCEVNLTKDGVSNSEIARVLRISRGSVFGLQ